MAQIHRKVFLWILSSFTHIVIRLVFSFHRRHSLLIRCLSSFRCVSTIWLELVFACHCRWLCASHCKQWPRASTESAWRQVLNSFQTFLFTSWREHFYFFSFILKISLCRRWLLNVCRTERENDFLLFLDSLEMPLSRSVVCRKSFGLVCAFSARKLFFAIILIVPPVLISGGDIPLGAIKMSLHPENLRLCIFNGQKVGFSSPFPGAIKVPPGKRCLKVAPDL